MNKQEQIKEMAFSLIMATSPLGVEDLTKQFDYDTVAKYLYDAGYRKAYEHDAEIKSLNRRIAELEEELVHADENVFYREQNLLLCEEKVKVEARKETAKEIFEEIEKLTYRLLNDKDYVVGDMIVDILDLAQNYGVEVE